jgi:hypothetical protein
MNLLRGKYSVLIAPLVCVALLTGAGWVQRDLRAPASFEPYHAKAKAAIEAIPTNMGSWIGTERKVEPAAQQLLRPNIIRSMVLADNRVESLRGPQQSVFLTIVQCRRALDMLGHYPPRCYPAIGDTLQESRPRTWVIDDGSGAKPGSASNLLPITGTEYEFERIVEGQTRRRVVYFFMVVPGKGIAADMKALEEAADDYQQRYYGAAQFQVVFDSIKGQGPSSEQRDETYQTLMTEIAPAIRALMNPEP